MVKYVLLLVLTFSAPAFGVAEIDPLVGMVRHKFAQSFSPSSELLGFGENWNCHSLSLIREKLDRTTEYRSFHEQGTVKHFKMRKSGSTLYKDTSYRGFGAVAQTDLGLMMQGRETYSNETAALRMTNEGELIIEFSAPPGQLNSRVAADSIAVDGNLAWRYSICRKVK
jgi:hypothetical protein